MARNADKFWVAARKSAAKESQSTARAKDLFRGTAKYEKALIEGVRVFRLTVLPGGATWPQSYAIDEAFHLRWTQLKSRPPTFVVDWRQEAQSRWRLSWQLEQSEQILGLGERYGGLNLRGRVHTLVATDDDQHLESTDSLYKCIPFLTILKDGTAYGVFLDSPAPQRWDLDSDRNGKVQVRLLSRRPWQLYWFERQSLPHIVAAYSRLTGRSNLPPQWSLGHQQSRWSYPTERKVREIAREFRTRKIPCDTIVLDIDYMDDYRAFTVSRERFPQFENMVTDLLRVGFRVVTIVDPAVKKSVRDATYRDGIKRDAFCKNADGKPFVGQVWPGLCCLPDFMRDAVRAWWGHRLNFLLSRGVAGIWNDMNEPALFGNQRPLSADAQELPKDDQQLFLQSAGQGAIGHFEVRNLYGQQMARSTCDALQKARPNERPFVLTRSGYAGIQRFSAVWLGDNRSWFEHLRLSIPMLLNMGLSGVPFCGVDIGGFGGSSDAELLLRWYQLGIFYPFCRNHCALDGRSQEPWSFGSRVEKTIRRLIGVRYQLIPYFEQLFVEHRKTGAPLMRPLCWHYPSDRTARQLDDQFLLGSDLLVAPIVHRGRTRRPVYLPKGRWFRFDGGPAWLGGRYYDVEWTTDNVPAFIREGAILPIAGSVQHSAQLATASITFRCYGNPAKGRYWQDDGSSLGYQRGQYNEWIVSLKGQCFRAKCVHRGFAQPDRRYFYDAGGRRFPLEWGSKVTDTD